MHQERARGGELDDTCASDAGPTQVDVDERRGAQWEDVVHTRVGDPRHAEIDMGESRVQGSREL